eukprot:Colp12_sorted_trinity150504_noHs@11355
MFRTAGKTVQFVNPCVRSVRSFHRTCVQFDYYSVLGVSRTATQAEIKHRFYDLAREHHPDSAGQAALAKFQQISEAYNTLGDPATRREYDMKFGIGVASAGYAYSAYSY